MLALNHIFTLHAKLAIFARSEWAAFSSTSYLSSDCKLGNHVFMNTECVVGHDSVVLDFNCLFQGRSLRNCFIEESCTFGIGSLVLPGIRMKEGSKLDAMSVLRDSK